MSQDGDQPRLEAWLDTDGDDDQLHLRVTANGTEYHRTDADLETLLQTEQFLSSFQRPALSMLSVWEREVAEEVADAAEQEAGGLDESGAV